jgi:ketosteroid isomerase-like protein
MAHPHEQLLRQAYADFSRGDLPAYLNVCTDSITFRVPGRSVVAGTYDRGQFGPGLIARVMEASGGTFRETVLDVVANDTRGVVLAYHEFERNGRTRGYNTAHIYRIEGGRLASFEEYPEDLYAFDEAWT